MQEVIKSVPIVPMRGIVTLPGESVSFEVGRTLSINAINHANENDKHIILLCQKNPRLTNISVDNMYETGTYCHITSITPDNNENSRIIHITAFALERVKIEEIYENGSFIYADATILRCDEPDADRLAALMRMITSRISAYSAVQAIEKNDIETLKTALAKDCSSYCDAAASVFIKNVEKKQRVLETTDIFDRTQFVVSELTGEIKLLELNINIDRETRKNIDKNQREYFLREKIATIKHELGDDTDTELENIKKRAEEKQLPESVKERLNREIKRLESLPLGSHEAPTIRSFIECVLDLPWSEKTEDIMNLNKAQEILDRDHYGLKKVKDRIIEYLAVAARTGSLSGQIICLVGPPGVGKTSIVSSVAEATGRNFVRMSLGGIDDEAEIRGHRRTYIGAMPGRIITAMRQAKTINPVILFDEIDKLNKNIHGDPAAAMLEVLDSAQNSTFRDHFLEIPYDLSQVMFITTANSLDTIPRPLLDRMEVIEVPGYLEYEKVQIAMRHLIPRQFKKHALTATEFNISEDAILQVIREYTRESGVRTLDRTIATLCRNAAYELEGGKNRLVLNPTRISKYLGAPKYSFEEAEKHNAIGVVNGLAWTSVGGETLVVEVLPIPSGSGKLELTGSLGDVMKESAKTALTFVKANSGKYDVDPDFFNKHDIHIHVPEGAVPKDGPSAGITLMTAIMSAVTEIPVIAKIAMTGEITLRGNVLKIGGLREKLLAAIRAGITDAIVPLENKADVEKMEDEIKKNIKITFVSRADEVLEKALAKPAILPSLKKSAVGKSINA